MLIRFIVFTAGSIICPISRVMGAINKFGFRCFASFTDALRDRKKIRKIGDKTFSVFTAGSIFWPISRIMGVINEFGFRCFAAFLDALTARKKSEKSATKSFSFLMLITS